MTDSMNPKNPGWKSSKTREKLENLKKVNETGILEKRKAVSAVLTAICVIALIGWVVISLLPLL